MLQTVQIRQAAIDEMLAHAREEAPNECCGLLIGTLEQIDRAVRARNLKASPTRYLVDPVGHFAALRTARAANLAIVGVYHSHPHSPAVPSDTDLVEASYAEYLYVIVSLVSRDLESAVRAYRLHRESFVPIEVITVV